VINTTVSNEVNSGIPVVYTGRPDYPDSITEFLKTCPYTGDGVNVWIMSAACKLRHFISETEARDILLPIVIEAGRSAWKANAEITRAIDKAFGSIGKVVHGKQPVWAEYDPELVKERASLSRRLYEGMDGALYPVYPSVYDNDLAALQAASPHDCKLTADKFLELLFPGDPLICAGWHNWKFDTRRLSEWGNELQSMQFVVPSPMIAKLGITQDGRESAHCLDNTGPRRFLVVEFDVHGMSLDQQAAITLHLKKYCPLVLVLHSGGKSLHLWIRAWGESEAPDSKLVRFFNHACKLGADRRLWLRSQFVRMPQGQRDNRKRQRVLYFAPEVLK
jgi:hypothetical protein